jgi:hypothetical protein
MACGHFSDITSSGAGKSVALGWMKTRVGGLERGLTPVKSVKLLISA